MFGAKWKKEYLNEVKQHEATKKLLEETRIQRDNARQERDEANARVTDLATKKVSKPRTKKAN